MGSGAISVFTQRDGETGNYQGVKHLQKKTKFGIFSSSVERVQIQKCQAFAGEMTLQLHQSISLAFLSLMSPQSNTLVFTYSPDIARLYTVLPQLLVRKVDTCTDIKNADAN